MMSTDTITRCAGGCGRTIDLLNDVPPTDGICVHSTAVLDELHNPWAGTPEAVGYCDGCRHDQGAGSPS